MPDAFFSSGKSKVRKRKRDVSLSKPSTSKPAANGRVKRSRRDEELSDSDAGEVGGIEDMELRADDIDPGESGDEDVGETPAEKRLRLARMVLEDRRKELAGDEIDAAEVDKELLASRLRQDTLQHSGKISLFLAEKLNTTSPPTRFTRRQRLPITAAVASDDATLLYTGSKDGTITKFSLQTVTHLKTYSKIAAPAAGRKGKGKGKVGADVEGHVDEVLALAISFDGRYLASGGRDRRVLVWDVKEDKLVKVFEGHKDAITALAFRKNSLQLYSASLDRTIKLHDLSVMGYVETLFGHQDGAASLDTLLGETAVSAGMRDRALRYWKIADETQLVFRGGGRSKLREVLEGGMEEASGGEEEGDASMVNGRKAKGKEKEKGGKSFLEGSIDCVAMLDESTFVSGGDSGSICLWLISKKKPIYTQPLAHGIHEHVSESEGTIATPRWITALGAVRYGDLFASGSHDSTIRLWKLEEKARSFSAIGTIPAPGFVNSLQLITPPRDYALTHTWGRSQGQETDGLSEVNSEAKNKFPLGRARDEVLLIAGVGQEPRLGRWMRAHGAGEKNAALVVALPRGDLIVGSRGN
ncbi:pre-rRNA processing protein [Ceratobasidium sp. 394]|nr:pre-rRNA processing protein [Ceratobasidium sp. 394]